VHNQKASYDELTRVAAILTSQAECSRVAAALIAKPPELAFKRAQLLMEAAAFDLAAQRLSDVELALEDERVPYTHIDPSRFEDNDEHCRQTDS